MRILNQTRGTVLGSRVRLADSWWSRLRGFLFRPQPQPGEGILLAPCDAIHTWGMRYALDVIFVDPVGRVLRIIENLPPRKIPSSVPGARYVLEVRAGTVASTGTAVGDSLSWAPASAPSPSLSLQEI